MGNVFVRAATSAFTRPGLGPGTLRPSPPSATAQGGSGRKTSRAGGDAVPTPRPGRGRRAERGVEVCQRRSGRRGAAAARELRPCRPRSSPGCRGAAGGPGLRRCGAGAAPAPGVRRLTGGAAGATPPPLAARAAEAAAALSALAALPPRGSAAPGGCEWAPRGEARVRAAAALGAPGPSAAPPPRKKCSSL